MIYTCHPRTQYQFASASRQQSGVEDALAVFFADCNFMSFATWYYPFFLAAVVAAFWLLPRRQRLAFILVASLFFYSFWDIRFCALLIAAAASDYLCTLGIEADPPSTATALAIGMLPTGWLLAAVPFKHVEGLHFAAAAVACLAFCLLFIA